MNADEKARKICVPLYRDIHDDLGGTISMGDIAAIIGQRMHDACIEMHNWTLETSKPTAGKGPIPSGLDRREEA